MLNRRAQQWHLEDLTKEAVCTWTSIRGERAAMEDPEHGSVRNSRSPSNRMREFPCYRTLIHLGIILSHPRA
jgi:hypothetical protein